MIRLLCYQAGWKANERLYLVPRGLDVQASLGERRLHADEEPSVGRLVGGGVRTRRGWREEEEKEISASQLVGCNLKVGHKGV